jgi:hypothetical protein
VTDEAARVTSLTESIPLRGSGRFVTVVLLAPALLLIGHLLPETGPGLALRLASAAACVLLVPGALLLRAIAWPASPGVALAGSFALSLGVVAFGLALAFVVGASILLTAAVIVAVSLVMAIPAARRSRSDPLPQIERRATASVLTAGIVYAGMVWWAASPLVGDALFHVARARKLADLGALDTLQSVGEFKDGGLHPGYAFPLWQAVDALIARFAGLDVTLVLRYLPAVLVPLAFLLAYAAGCAIFRSRAGGLMFIAVQAAYYGLGHGGGLFAGTGFYETLSQPQAASLLLLFPAALTLAFTFAVDGGRVTLLSLGAIAFALTGVHPSYTPYLALLLGGFLVARLILVRGWEPLLTRTAIALGAIAIPFGLVLLIVLPVAVDTSSFMPSAAHRAKELTAYGDAFTRIGDQFAMSPAAIARGGAVLVAGLLAIPLAGFAGRRLWAALVLGGSLAILAVLLAPPLFTVFSDALTVSQSRRLPQFLPIPVAITGACIVFSRLRAGGAVLAGAVGLLLVLGYPGEFSYTYGAGGPGWVVWVAVAGGLVALGLGALLQTRVPNPGAWAIAAVAAFLVPVTVTGLAGLHSSDSRPWLTSSVVQALRADVPTGDVVFSYPGTAYQVAAYAPVYVNASKRGHVADSPKNQVHARAADAHRFFADPRLSDAARRGILVRWGAGWVLVDKRRPAPEDYLSKLGLVFQDRRFALYEVGS